MTTTPRPTQIGRYTVCFDPCPDGYGWHVQDDTGYAVDSCETRDEAVASAISLEADAALEDFRAEMEALREKIMEAVEDCEDEATLRAVLALLGR